MKIVDHSLARIAARARPTDDWIHPSAVGTAHLGGYGVGEFGDAGSYYPNLWTWAVKLLNIESVIDVGCGEAHSTRFFLELGCDAIGVEGYAPAIERSGIVDRIVVHDYCDGPYVPNREFDLAWSCEFVEHVEERYLPNFMATFSRAACVFMTFAQPGAPGHHHVNAQEQAYWVAQFAARGYELDRELTECGRRIALADRFLLSPAEDNATYFAQSGCVFVHRRQG